MEMAKLERQTERRLRRWEEFMMNWLSRASAQVHIKV